MREPVFLFCFDSGSRKGARSELTARGCVTRPKTSISKEGSLAPVEHINQKLASSNAQNES